MDPYIAYMSSVPEGQTVISRGEWEASKGISNPNYVLDATKTNGSRRANVNQLGSKIPMFNPTMLSDRFTIGDNGAAFRVNPMTGKAMGEGITLKKNQYISPDQRMMNKGTFFDSEVGKGLSDTVDVTNMITSGLGLASNIYFANENKKLQKDRDNYLRGRDAKNDARLNMMQKRYETS